MLMASSHNSFTGPAALNESLCTRAGLFGHGFSLQSQSHLYEAGQDFVLECPCAADQAEDNGVKGLFIDVATDEQPQEHVYGRMEAVRRQRCRHRGGAHVHLRTVDAGSDTDESGCGCMQQVSRARMAT